MFTEYPYSDSYEARGCVPKPGDMVIIANRYIYPAPQAVIVTQVYRADGRSGAKITTHDGLMIPLSACYLDWAGA